MKAPYLGSTVEAIFSKRCFAIASLQITLPRDIW
jgi:hypothetical protein